MDGKDSIEAEELSSSSVKVMAEKHNVIRAHLEQAEAELDSKKAQLEYEEERVRQRGGEICIAEQNLRSLNEKMFLLHQTYTELQKKHQELLNELVHVTWTTEKTSEAVQKKKKAMEENISAQNAFKEKVLASEASLSAENDPQYIAIKKEVDDLLELKSRLEKGDPELKRIWTGQALQMAEVQKTAILDAFSEREIEAELLEAELEEKQKAIAKAEQGILIEEKQNQARLRKLQKQLHDLEETEQHLKSTVQHLEKQIDFYGH